jgi:hypothetical protein
MLHVPPSLKNDPRCEIWGDSPTPFPLGPLGKANAFIDYGHWQLELEIDDPIIGEEERKEAPMFRDPRTGKQLTASAFDTMAMNAINDAYEEKGVFLSLAEVKEMYGIHSFRIGGDIIRNLEHQSAFGRKSDTGYLMRLKSIQGQNWRSLPNT